MFINRRHGNTNREPAVAFCAELTTKIVTFIQNYTEANAILLPGQIPRYKNYNMKLLPSSTSKKAVYLEYIKANAAETDRLPSMSAFNRIWQKYLPNIIITKPMTDLCWICQRNSTASVRSANNLEKQSEVSNVILVQVHLL